MQDLIGQSLGRYHITEKLGEGGMATVYKAFDTRLERDVAIKIIRRDAFSKEVVDRMLQRFEREAKALSKMTHPNIVPFIDYGDEGGSPYLVMPLINGGTLKDGLVKKIYTASDAARLLVPIAHALEYAHSRGILHRDVKPSNILITDNGDPLLSDFGVAKILEDAEGSTLTGTGVGLGTPEYMAPEQWIGKATPASDQYSLGVILYEMLTKHKPYSADTPAAVLLKQATEALPRPREFTPNLPDEVERILFKSLAKKPEDRYSSLSEMAQALTQFERSDSRVMSSNHQNITATSDNFATVDQMESKILHQNPPPLIPPQVRVNSYPKPRSKIPLFLGLGAGLVGLIFLIITISGGFSPKKYVRPIMTKAPSATEAPIAAVTEAATYAATEAPAVATEAPAGKTVLNVWSFTNEILTMAVAFEKTHPDVDVVYTMIPMTNGEYQTRLMDTLGTDQVPDVVALEAAFVKQYVESDFLADLTNLKYYADELGTYRSVLDIGTNYGVIKAYSYQATPGAFFYRRSLAREYFGTDDPVAIQALVSDMDKFTAAAEVVKNASGGNTFMVSSSGDFTSLFYGNRSQPWVVNGVLTIDPMVEQMVATAKIFRDNGYESRATQWTEGWFAGMNDSLRDANGNQKQIFCYFLPTWGLPYVLSPNSTSADGTSTTFGDWAMINGPLPWQWGGTWIGVMNESRNLDLAKEFIRFVALDEENLTNWATGVYTNEYLKAIDSTVPDDQQQAAGDFVSSQVVAEKITSRFNNTSLNEFLGGQNFYGAFASAAANVSARVMQGSDDAIQRALNDPLNSYLEGYYTEEEMWAAWKDEVRAMMPYLIIN